VPLPLREVWLRFHEAELCRGLDAVFVFRKQGMEAWIKIEDEKSYRKLVDLLAPLRASYRINLYVTHAVREKKPTDPPPSLLENAELRGYLEDPYARIGSPDDSVEVSPRDQTRQAGSPWGDGRPGGQPVAAMSPPSPNLAQRILAFGDQTLDSTRQMKRYADDLPMLAFMACDPAEPQNLRTRAMAVCLQHAQKLDRYAGRLEDNLAHALPPAAKPGKVSSSSNESSYAGISPTEDAVRISDAAQTAARQIHRFIYPKHPTVGTVDLREPDLLESLRKLRRLVKEFQEQSGVKPPHSKALRAP